MAVTSERERVLSGRAGGVGLAATGLGAVLLFVLAPRKEAALARPAQ